jgi:DNA helicase-2/ATP-dependent DNA helicase PcrA
VDKIRLRPAQEEVLRYQGGKMGVSAVPGSGKTWTLSLLAAEIVARGELAEDQEVLVVTLVNSAVDHFYQRVSSFLGERGLIPYLGYRVRTLHSLAHDIVRQRPSLVGLEDNFQIVDEREASAILLEAAQSWLRSHPGELEGYLDDGLDEGRLNRVRRDQLPDLVCEIALSFMRYAKDQRLTPERLRQRLDALPMTLPLAEMGLEIYQDYQRALAYRGAVDFDDLIRLALQALETDVAYLERLRYQWPFILEDEAQDSSRLQEEILELLAGKDGNWVRVGDSNQAIYETFTTANPRYLRDFLRREDVIPRQLPNSGRSTLSIIALANELVKWTQEAHPVEAVRDALQAPPWIEPTPPDDPQPNPPDDPDQIHLVRRRFTPVDEIQTVADSLRRWLPDHPDWTVAVLTPRNQRGFELVDELRRRNIPCEDGLLRSSTSTRLSAGVLGDVFAYLADPDSPRKLAQAYRAWRREESKNDKSRKMVERVMELLRKIERLEDYLWPGPEWDWLAELEAAGVDEQILATLQEFRRLMRRWQNAALLPVDQMTLALAQDLFSEPVELALAHKLAGLLRQASQTHPVWRLPEMSEELGVIARNERRFIGFSRDDTGFDPERYKGVVVVSTMHRAKGLEWDRVYLMSVNDYDFPSAQEGDTYFAEKWFLRDHLNLEAEALAQLKAALEMDEYRWYEEGRASQEARLDYTRERLRLFYVGITRARRELVVTWNTGRDGDRRPALPLVILQELWELLKNKSE